MCVIHFKTFLIIGFTNTAIKRSFKVHTEGDMLPLKGIVGGERKLYFLPNQHMNTKACSLGKFALRSAKPQTFEDQSCHV